MAEISEFERIKTAVELEERYGFVDLKGRECVFSTFMKREIRKIAKDSDKKRKWKNLEEKFEFYPYENYMQRKKTVVSFVKTFRAEFFPEETKKRESAAKPKFVESIYEKDVTYVKGVGPKVSAIFNKLGIFTVYDLLTYYPKKYLDFSTRTRISDLQEGQCATIFGTVKNVAMFDTKRGLTVLNVGIADESGYFELTFFYGRVNNFMKQRYKSRFPKGAKIMVSGIAKFDKFSGNMTLDRPECELTESGDADESEKSLHSGRIVPVYGLCENLNVKVLRKAVNNALNDFKDGIKSVVPEYIRAKYDIEEKYEALKQIHFPKTFDDASKAKFALVFEEVFLLKLRMNEGKIGQTGVKLEIKPDGYVQKFIKNLPFELTEAQKNAINEILNDVNSEVPMNRLLQGDVGSGKTVVACCLLLAAAENGYQSAIMAPTEILATQHYNNFVPLLLPLGLNVALFKASMPRKVRAEAEKNLASGQINIAVGTHALISEGVQFKNLGAVIVDEQHRFGVKQRNALRSKAVSPQMLTMSATPIPRTLALTAHGDLKLTVIGERPPGRRPIITKLFKGAGRKDAYSLIKDEIKKGHGAYIVFPLIEESESISAKAATVEAEKLQAGEFKDFKVGLMHGKMKPDEKDRVMDDFKNGRYDILVSTTVIEVGVDVPKATVMMIENAERFGLSQLHQLRGRVGRNDLQSYCLLATSSKSAETLARLEIMTQTDNGFLIAEKDLAIRGPGEFLGVRQSGLPELNLTDLTKDVEIIERATACADEFLKEHSVDEFPDLKEFLARKRSVFTGAEALEAG